MSEKRVTRTITVCDVCGRENQTFNHCIVCKKDHCFNCVSGPILGCIVRPDLCRECSERKDFLTVVAKWAKRIDSPRKRRDAELVALPVSVLGVPSAEGAPSGASVKEGEQ